MNDSIIPLVVYIIVSEVLQIMVTAVLSLISWLASQDGDFIYSIEMCEQQ